MGGFSVAFTNVLLIVLYMMPGFLLCRAKKLSTDNLAALSSILIYALAPCLNVATFLNMDYSMGAIKNMGLFFVASMAVQILFMLILYFLFRSRYDDAKYRILTIGSVLGNVGFFGQPLIKQMLPEYPIAACYSVIYVLAMNILVFTVGVYCLTEKKEYITIKKAILNPATLSFVLAFILYLLKVSAFIPVKLFNSIDLLGKMTTPVCMIILGARLGAMKFKDIFTNIFVYIICIGKLLIYPLFALLCVYFLPLNMAFKASLVILSGTPCASVILNMAEIHKSEREISANILLISTLLCVLSIPLLILIIGNFIC